MKLLLFFSLFLLLSVELHSQTITGKVVDAASNDLLEYVSIGIIKTPIGTITNESGKFNLEFKNQSPKAIVRFSMIGYKAQTFSIEELSEKENIIKLEQKTVQIAEIIVKSNNTIKKVGTTNRSLQGVCGWGGNSRGRGHEIGLKINLGTSFVKLRSLHVRMDKQSYDSSLFRLHIRDIKNDLPHNELLNENILITITNTSGWVNIDLSKYNIVLNGEIALTLEWLKVLGLNKNNLVRVNNSKQKTANVFISIKNKQGCMYNKWGVEAKWKKNDSQSPSIYLTVQ